MPILRYGWSAGLLAWAVHRATGLVLTLYLFAHLYVLGAIRDPERFNSFVALTRHPLVKLAELGLLAAVAAHALNGVRVSMAESGAPSSAHKPVLAIMAIVFALIMAMSAHVFLGGALG